MEKGAAKRFGIVLLHQHFDLADDEELVEFCDSENRILTTMPVKRSDLPPGELVETTWRLDTQPAEALAKCVQACFVDLKGKHSRSHVRQPGPLP